jgi:hypothetical protein
VGKNFKLLHPLPTHVPVNPIFTGNILTVADDLLKNDGQKFLEMMEQLAERRMQREQQAAQDLEADSDADHGEEGDDDDDEDDDEDDDDEEDEEEEVCVCLFHCAAMLTCAGAH